jgi:hypothetical protein
MTKTKAEMIALMFYNHLEPGDMFQSSIRCFLWREPGAFLELGEAGLSLAEMVHNLSLILEPKLPFLLLEKANNLNNQNVRKGKYQFKVLYNNQIAYLSISGGESVAMHFKPVSGAQ